MLKKKVLGWFGHLERMNEDRLASKVWKSTVNGTRPRGRPRAGWVNGVLNGLHDRGLSFEQGKERAQDRSEWKTIVNRQQ